MNIFSLATGGLETKSLPSLVFDVKIMKAIGFFLVSNLLDEVLTTIVEVWRVCCEIRVYLCVWKVESESEDENRVLWRYL